MNIGRFDRVRKQGRATTGNQQESGVYAVVAVMLTTLLLGISALAVDLANARMIRTQAQNTVDSATLAAAQDLPDTVKVLATVKAYAYDNFKLPASAWVGCADEGALATVIDTDTSNRCITTDATKTRLRVRLPITKMRTSFGRTIGVENVAIRAAAEAEATPGMDNRMFPTALVQTDSDGLECLERGGSSTGCGPTHTGTFGSVDSPRLNIHKTSNIHDVMKLNYAIGIDHGLTTDAVAAKVCDGSAIVALPPAFSCAGNIADPSLLANHLDLSPGGNVTTVTQGMLDGGTITTSDPTSSPKEYCGRLTRPDRTPANINVLKPGGTCTLATPPTISLGSKTVNGHHISMWLTAAAKAHFYPLLVGNPAYENAGTNATYSAGDNLLDCYLRYFDPVTHAVTLPTPTPAGCKRPVTNLPITGLGAPIFLPGIVNDIRYGTVPTLCEVSVVPCRWPGPSSIGAIKEFKGAFIYKIVLNGGGNVQAFTGWVFDLWLVDPGSTPLGSSSTPIVHLSK